LQQDFSWK